MAKPKFIELPGCKPIPILYEDRSVLAVDKPRGWMLVPVSWQKTARNLQAAINSSIAARDFWARSRGLKFLHYVHRLDADTSGILLFAKSPGAVKTYSDLFESRRMEKTYLAVVTGEPKEDEWTCRLKLAPDPQKIGRMKTDARNGKIAETHFCVVNKIPGLTLMVCKPVTGRTHQIRVHLAESGCPIVGDELYGNQRFKKSLSCTNRREKMHFKLENIKTTIGYKVKPRHLGCYEAEQVLGLRAVRLGYADPFNRWRVEIQASVENFLREYGFDPF